MMERKMSKENSESVALRADDVTMLRRTAAELEQRRESLVASIHGLTEARRTYALAAAKGDQTAKAELDRLTADERDVTNSARDTELALAEARKELGEAERAFANAESNSKLAEAIRIRDLLLVESAKIDEAAATMAASLELRAELRNQLIKTGAFPPKYVNHLISKGALHRALHKAGLTEFCDLPRDNAHRVSLHEQDATTLTAIRKLEISHTQQDAA
jgi:hypothetical protein